MIPSHLFFVFVLYIELVTSFGVSKDGFHSLKESLKNDVRIVGGFDVEPNSIPYQVSFQTNSNVHICGGVIYNNITVITAGHCCIYQDGNLYDLNVVAGEHNLRLPSNTEQVRTVDAIRTHSEYTLHHNDICLLKLEKPFEFNEYVSSVPIAREDQEFEGNGIISGWGRLHFNGYPSNVLRAANVPLLSIEKCQEIYGDLEIDESVICAGNERVDACQGDDGGPLICDGILCGIVSWGNGCAFEESPHVFTKISAFHKWITDHAF